MAVYDINRILVPDAPPEYEDHTRDVHYVPAPCQVACPIGTDAPSYIAHIWDEDYEGAFEAITSTNPFSSICGRVCDAPCEPACRRVDSDGAVQIRNLKRWHPMPTARARAGQLLGLLLASRRDLEDAIVYALERGFDLLVLDGTGALGREWPELRAAPDLALVRDTIATLRRLKKEEMIDIAWFGGARSGTDAAKLVGLGVNAIGYGVAVALALGGEITHTGVRFAPDRNEDERAGAVVNILKANAGEASMMARCAGKTRLHNIEPEDLRSITRATAAATGIPLAGTRAA